jgi:hypothetical protein
MTQIATVFLVVACSWRYDLIDFSSLYPDDTVLLRTLILSRESILCRCFDDLSAELN